uniref:Calponin-homology (CH) domain-containing protein n=1 Tax=Glossina brevipalpis TaxID=37001 RepID=A0A1A9X404_9MUSC
MKYINHDKLKLVTVAVQVLPAELSKWLEHSFTSCDPYNESFDEDMEAERDLAEDAQWKKIQQNTFTRWANEHLKTIDRSINNLESDLSDGLRLIALIEVLSQKRMPKYNKRPTFRSQKLENVSVALKFLEDEGIKIVNIGKWHNLIKQPRMLYLFFVVASFEYSSPQTNL